jgi:hypothetical protein
VGIYIDRALYSLAASEFMPRSANEYPRPAEVSAVNASDISVAQNDFHDEQWHSRCTKIAWYTMRTPHFGGDDIEYRVETTAFHRCIEV